MEFKSLIAGETAAIDRIMKADIDSHTQGFDPLLTEILEYGLFSGGKRVRPLLVILGARICGNNNPDVYNLAIAFEYLHAATLFHDDVIDRADTRRGRMSVSRKYGTVGAILAGDYLHAHSMALMGQYGGNAALAKFTEATRGMVDGEFVQMRNARKFNQSEEDYFSVVMRKTALLIGAACEIGGMYGGADPAQQQALNTYGVSLGCAFQIVDDLLDYLGDQQKTGKVVGNDLVEGKMTLPLILLMQRAEPAEKKWLLDLLSEEHKRQGHINDVKLAIEKYDGFTDARKKAENIIGQAVGALGVFDLESNRESLDILHGLTQYVLSREN